MSLLVINSLAGLFEQGYVQNIFCNVSDNLFAGVCVCVGGGGGGNPLGALGFCLTNQTEAATALQKAPRGTVEAFHCGNMLALSWVDKRRVLMLSTKHCTCTRTQAYTHKHTHKHTPNT